VSHVPQYDILLLDSLIVLIIRELPTGAEAPGNVFTHIGATNRNIKISELVSFAIVLYGAYPAPGRIQTPWPFTWSRTNQVLWSAGILTSLRSFTYFRQPGPHPLSGPPSS